MSSGEEQRRDKENSCWIHPVFGMRVQHVTFLSPCTTGMKAYFNMEVWNITITGMK
jgi:hypothetical protein